MKQKKNHISTSERRRIIDLYNTFISINSGRTYGDADICSYIRKRGVNKTCKMIIRIVDSVRNRPGYTEQRYST